ncbi:lytic transglycosylase domain-containing protein [Gluconobacter albidus]|uniref:lytic transglycosylase domain-containing protein n=1 Tax=Gluconobacter albidus TaxID=318683 RepID=UPI001B8B86A8|nr:lytic transglycosylase domain-containing protein [Gluconobacter albidus]MBS1028315.1 transglycosylase SLT domain-containing protein [Gluconobacter albidus]
MPDYSHYYDDAGKRFNVDAHLLRAIARQETGENEHSANSPAGAVGMMQIMPATAKSLGVDPHDPVQSIYGAANLMGQLLKAHGNVPDALRDYNAGPDKRRWDNKETAAYVGGVATHYRDLLSEGTMAKKPQATPAKTGDLSDFEKQWGLSSPTTQATPQPAPTPDLSAFEKQWGIAKPQVSSAPAPMGQSPIANNQPEYEKHNWVHNALLGIGQGGRDVFDSGVNGTDWVTNHLLGHTPLDQLKSYEDNNRTQYDKDYGGSVAANVGRLAGNVAATAPLGGGLLGAGAKIGVAGARALGVGEGIARLGGMLAGDAAAGAGSNLATNSRTNESAAQSAADGAALGLIAGPVGSVLGKGAKAISESVTGGTVSKARAELAQLARDKYGINLTAPQVSNSQGMKYLASGVAGGNTTPEQLGQFTRAVSRTFGADSPTLEPAVVDNAYRNLGSQFDQYAKRHSVELDDTFLNDLSSAENSALQNFGADRIAAVRNQFNDVLGRVGDDGMLSGDQYHALTKFGAPLQKAMSNSDPEIRSHAHMVKDALDSALERTLVAKGDTEGLNGYRGLKLQYKNLKTVDSILKKTGKTGGVLNPSLLEGVVNRSFKSRARAGAGDLGDLADIGQAFLKDQPNSGTAGRLEAGAIAAALGDAALHGDVAIPATLATAAVSRAATRAALDSKPLVDRLIARSLPDAFADNALTRGLSLVKKGLPFATAVPAADAYTRNALLGY